MNIKSCYVAKDKAHRTRYQELQNYKQARKGVLRDILVQVWNWIGDSEIRCLIGRNKFRGTI